MSEPEKSAADCESLDEVRQQIDRIDKGIVALIAERSAYVLRAASFKKSHADVPAPQRAEEVVRKAKGLAVESGANPAVVERVYREMIAAFIEAEMAEISARPFGQRPSGDLSTAEENA
ncbi:MAG: chorismate mutase [Terracidiphilus sp.]